MPAEQAEHPNYDCDTCHRTFQFRRHYLKHLEVHKDNLFCKCLECVAAFNSEIQLRDHLRTHAKDSTLMCMNCSKTLSSPDIRKQQENNHFIGNRFICEVCNRTFDTEMSLEQHLPLHGAENPVNSGVYTGEFTQKKAEEIFTHDHDAEKQLRCHICEKIFVNCFENGTHLRVLDYSYNRGGISLVICVLVEKHLNSNVQVSATEYSAMCVNRLTFPSSIKC
ncbi:hypothetical protein TNIN_262211 [Trichonephila inaurata madagascariensis]|uniref:C2H2-type domain-containing protein n=1 Tax=Trichonephila inaurata madagascariensis TaxID=2747483 RepID=A0A8X7BVI9_9ARAC|nr:hypothetical protein TNIN_262211 [Trichonephila inaurata madagascariensis]